MDLVDTHCHLTELSEEELLAQIDRAQQAGVTKLICIGAGYGVDAAKRAVKIAESHENVWATVGIHPHNAADRNRLNEIEALAINKKVIAIGETGLDFFRDWSPFEDQRALFRETILLAKGVKKPLVIHCRDAAAETIETLSSLGAAEVGGVFHCYSEDAEFARKAAEINFRVSFPGSLTFKKAETIRETAKAIPLEQIMLETDSPYMAPEPYRGKPSEPAHVRLIAETLARVKNISIEEVARVTSATASSLFGLR